MRTHRTQRLSLCVGYFVENVTVEPNHIGVLSVFHCWMRVLDVAVHCLYIHDIHCVIDRAVSCIWSGNAFSSLKVCDSHFFFLHSFDVHWLCFGEVHCDTVACSVLLVLVLFSWIQKQLDKTGKLQTDWLTELHTNMNMNTNISNNARHHFAVINNPI